MPEPSPLEVLEQAVLAAQANRQAREEALRGGPAVALPTPPHLEKSLRKRRDWEENSGRLSAHGSSSPSTRRQSAVSMGAWPS